MGSCLSRGVQGDDLDEQICREFQSRGFQGDDLDKHMQIHREWRSAQESLTAPAVDLQRKVAEAFHNDNRLVVSDLVVTTGSNFNPLCFRVGFALDDAGSVLSALISTSETMVIVRVNDIGGDEICALSMPVDSTISMLEEKFVSVRPTWPGIRVLIDDGIVLSDHTRPELPRAWQTSSCLADHTRLVLHKLAVNGLSVVMAADKILCGSPEVIETALFDDNGLVYSPALGYSDIRDFTEGEEVIAEIHRLLDRLCGHVPLKSQCHAR